jgi:UDP-2-acetamido-2-deoxy-ribo-hexuluronate aminotransferase
VHYPIPLNKQPAVASPDAQLSVGDEVAKEVVSLPMGPGLLYADQTHIAGCLRTCRAA